jgi:hypothetical protein
MYDFSVWIYFGHSTNLITLNREHSLLDKKSDLCLEKIWYI